MTDAALQEQYQKSIRQRDRARATCVAPEQLQQLVERSGSEEERLEILDHVMACPECHRELTLLHAIHAAQPRVVSLTPRQWLAAASLLIALGGGALLSRGLLNSSGDDLIRGDRTRAVTLLAPRGQVAEGGPGTLVWRQVPGAVQYVVEVLDTSNRVLLTKQTADTSVSVPPLAAPTLWWVRATLSDGSDRRSPIVRLKSGH